jgi:hypothetical protein
MRMRTRLLALLLATAGSAAGGTFAAASAHAAPGAFVYSPKTNAGPAAVAKEKTITDPKAGQCIKTPGAKMARNYTTSAIKLFSDANCHTTVADLRPGGTRRGAFASIMAAK